MQGESNVVISIAARVLCPLTRHFSFTVRIFLSNSFSFFIFSPRVGYVFCSYTKNLKIVAGDHGGGCRKFLLFRHGVRTRANGRKRKSTDNWWARAVWMQEWKERADGEIDTLFFSILFEQIWPILDFNQKFYFRNTQHTTQIFKKNQIKISYFTTVNDKMAKK